MLKQRTPSISARVAGDLFSVQIKWSLWYIAVIVLLHIFVLFIAARGIFDLSYGSTPVFMFVLGIIGGSFLSCYVKQGVTRKDYYLGAALAALGLSFTIAFVFFILSGIESVIYSALNMGVTIAPYNLQVSVEGSANGVISLLIYTLNAFTYYLIGWLVYLGFYRFRWVKGLGFGVLALLISSFQGVIWHDEILPTILPAMGGTVALIAVLLCLIRLVMSRVPIKV